MAEIKRLVYSNNVATTKQTIGTYFGYITAINEESNLTEDGKFWKLFKLSILCSTEIKEADEIVIDSVSYFVKWVAYRHWGHISLTTVILEKWQ